MFKPNLIVVSVLVCVQAFAQEAEKASPPAEVALQPVTVTASLSQPFKPYRAMFPGLKAYARLQALLAPQSQLRFRILKKDEADLSVPPPASVKVNLRGPETSTILALDADSGFELPLSQSLYDEDFDITLNQPMQAYRWRAYVRSPNVPPKARRLGDLRLECWVTSEISKADMGFAARAAMNVLTLGGDVCTSKALSHGTIAPEKLARARVVEGDKAKLLKTRDAMFEVPVADTAWSNEALIEFEFASP
jgi:hypothetical protein